MVSGRGIRVRDGTGAVDGVWMDLLDGVENRPALHVIVGLMKSFLGLVGGIGKMGLD